jgi:chromosome segregation ATPase
MFEFSARRVLLVSALAYGVRLVIGCQSVYYKTMEQFGYEKREILVDRVIEARDAQEETKDQFQSALEKFSDVVNIKGGDLEENYETLNTEYKRCESKAEAVSTRINEVQSVGSALFKEWEAELDQYSSANLRNASRQKLEQTRREYDRLIHSMRKAEAKITPVLTAFHDQVLYLKHNLNAQAIASLHQELATVENNVSTLIKEMEAAIGEANGFIKTIVES